MEKHKLYFQSRELLISLCTNLIPGSLLYQPSTSWLCETLSVFPNCLQGSSYTTFHSVPFVTLTIFSILFETLLQCCSHVSKVACLKIVFAKYCCRTEQRTLKVLSLSVVRAAVYHTVSVGEAFLNQVGTIHLWKLVSPFFLFDLSHLCIKTVSYPSSATHKHKVRSSMQFQFKMTFLNSL